MTQVIHHQNFRAISALDAQKRRPSDVLKDGERLHFNVNLIDSAGRHTADARAASIDATMKAEIEQAAKLANQKPAEYLSNLAARDLERLIERAAKAHVAAIGSEAVAKSFALDSIVRRTVDAQHAAHDHTFAFMGDRAPAFDRERADFLARAKVGAQPGMAGTATTDADRTRALAAGRYNTSAPLVDAEARPKAGAPAMHDAGGQARPAAVDALRRARYS